MWGGSEGQNTPQTLAIIGRRGGIRTRDLRLRRPTLYPAELLAHIDFAGFFDHGSQLYSQQE